MITLPAPMKAVAGVLPDDDDETWAYEIKWDGMRVVAATDPTAEHGIRAASTNGLDAAVRFPELDGLAEHLAGHEVVLDGEMVAFAGARSDFGTLQQRMHIASRAEAERKAATTPAVFVVFDLLGFDGTDTTGLPYLDRRRLLSQLVEPGPTWQVPLHQVGHGSSMLAAADERGLEGLIAKQTTSTYLPGKRSTAWRKIKIRRRQELVVGGWTESDSSRAFGALLVGHHGGELEGTGPELLTFAGGVGTGFDEAEVRRLRALLDELAAEASPFSSRLPPTVRRPHWVRPELVVEVEFGEWTTEGRLRHPAYLGQRLDVDPRSVRREPTP